MSDGLERLWAGWRRDYVTGAVEREPGTEPCPLCGVLATEAGAVQIVHADEHHAVILNAFPYTNGHVLVMPRAHVGSLDDLEPSLLSGFYAALDRARRAIELAYRPDGVNFGANLGHGAGAGIPEHVHAHVLPRWVGDTNFMTPVAGARVIPEAFETTVELLRDAWAALD